MHIERCEAQVHAHLDRTRSEIVTIKLSPETKAELMALAQSEGRRISQMAVILLEVALGARAKKNASERIA